MKIYSGMVLAGIVWMVVVPARGATLHVSPASPAPEVPYANWQTAATTIQEAIDAAVAGDTVLVSNGVYAVGGVAGYPAGSALTNRVAVYKAIAVRSVNGPEATIIRGAKDPATTNGEAAVRCVYLADGAILDGFTLTNGATRDDHIDISTYGGGAWGQGTNAILTNCVITGNSGAAGGGSHGGTLYNCALTGNAAESGGGSYFGALINCALTGNAAESGGGSSYGTLVNCTVTGNAAVSGGGSFCGTQISCVLAGNSATYGGGGYGGALSNCTVTGNAAEFGGGAYECQLENCIVYYNRALGLNENYEDGSLSYCCTTPFPSDGAGNVTNAPAIAGLLNPRLLPGSPCIDAGANQAWMDDAADWAGRSRINGGIVDIGACEFHSGTQTGALAMAARADWTDVATGFLVEFAADIDGECLGFDWQWADGTGETNAALASHAFAAPGTYDVVLRASNLTMAAAATVTVHVAEQAAYYVSPAGGHVAPFATWANAATTIQAAVDAALRPGDVVWVTNGVYDSGGAAGHPAGSAQTNRLSIYKPVAVRSVNGPEVTVIRGAPDPLTTNGAAAVRCVYMTNGATLAGFTLTNGATLAAGNWAAGGGIWCEGAGAAVSNCVVAGNSAGESGGGARRGTFSDCMFSGNWAEYAGAAIECTMNRCTVSRNWAPEGGGTYDSILGNCTLIDNVATEFDGGGASGGVLNNCLLSGNSATVDGGGADYATLNNCTLTGNSAGGSGGGAFESELENCIVYYNRAMVSGDNYSGGELSHCCATPLPAAGVGNLTNAPLVAGIANPRLLPGSPGIDAGTNRAWMAAAADWAGRSRVNGGIVDIGACEFQSGTQTGALSVAALANWTDVAAGFPVEFMADIDGECVGFVWQWDDGASETNAALAIHAFAAPGTYDVVLRASNLTLSAAATVSVHVAAQTVYCVSPSGGHVAPFASWENAATTIQAAVDAALRPGDLVLVTNGVYDSGGTTGYPAGSDLTNRVAIYKQVVVQSVNGPEVTVVRGAKDPATTNGESAVRCVYLADGAALIGFTLTNGATFADDVSSSGGGAWCEGAAAVLSNCVVSGNSARRGGGTHGGTLNNCALVGNSADDSGGGAHGGTLNDCELSRNEAIYGGGAQGSMLAHCRLAENQAEGNGGGVYEGSLANCTLSGNVAGRGGGAEASTLTGCLLTNNLADEGGGAAYSALADCDLGDNAATYYGGGATGCDLDGCTLVGNAAALGGGGAFSGTLTDCTLAGNVADGSGGGAASATLRNCTLAENAAGNSGGGASWSTLYNCAIYRNSATYDGGGTHQSTLNNCTAAGNTAGNSGGGTSAGAMLNCIVYGNAAPVGSNYSGGTFSASCTAPDPGGTGNVEADPLFADAAGDNYRLQPASPCANKGTNQAWMVGTTDLDGHPRIGPAGGIVDMGAYEYQWTGSVIPTWWLELYSLPIDGSADFIDTDDDTADNWSEWRAGTIPTNSESLFRLLGASEQNGVVIRWSSVTGRTYAVERSTNLLADPAFAPIQAGIVGQVDATTHTDATAVGTGPYFYRVGVQ